MKSMFCAVVVVEVSTATNANGKESDKHRINSINSHFATLFGPFSVVLRRINGPSLNGSENGFMEMLNSYFGFFGYFFCCAVVTNLGFSGFRVLIE